MALGLPLPDDVRAALSRLKSPRDGDRGVLDVVACGRRAIPALADLLFARDPSGLTQARVRAAEALSVLGAREVLIDFLDAPHDEADPVAQFGEEEVVSAVARALGDTHEERVFNLLLRLVHDRILPGIVAALGRSLRTEAIPELVRALGEDEARGEAETALKAFGAKALPALLVAAARAPRPETRETESELRRRRSALTVLVEIGAPAARWPVIRHLTAHPDPRIAAAACAIALNCASEAERKDAVRRLKALAQKADPILAARIHRWLGANHGCSPP